MSASGYQGSRLNPAGLAAAIAINAAILGALATSAPRIFVAPADPFEVYAVPIDPPPPPPPPEATAKVDKPVDARVLTPRPAVDTLPPVNDLAGTADMLVIPPPADLATVAGPATVAVDPPKPLPVLVDAAPDPRYARDFQPDYPPSERRAGSEGAVTVRVRVGADGRVAAVERVSAVSDAFFEATRRQALSRWRFRPATRDGVAVESWRTMTVRFVLEG